MAEPKRRRSFSCCPENRGEVGVYKYREGHRTIYRLNLDEITNSRRLVDRIRLHNSDEDEPKFTASGGAAYPVMFTLLVGGLTIAYGLVRGAKALIS